MENHKSLNSSEELEGKILEKLLKFAEFKSIPGKTIVFSPGDEGEYLYYVIRGKLSATVRQEEREYTLSTINEKEFFGEIAFFRENHTRTSELKSVEPCEFAMWKIDYFKELLQQDFKEESAKITFELGRVLALRWLKMSRQASSMALFEAPIRIWMTILEMAKQKDAMTHPKGMQIKVSRQDLAKLVGCSREMAGRIVKQFVKEGRMEAKGKAMVIYHEHLPEPRPSIRYE